MFEMSSPSICTVPLIRLQNACQHPQERGLARAVRADQAVDRAVLDFRADVIDRRDVLKRLVALVAVIMFCSLLSSLPSRAAAPRSPRVSAPDRPVR